MVFANYVAFILSTYLGKFIKGLNKNSVNISLLRGSFELKNLELAPDLLAFSDHVQLESGTVGSLSVKLPWHSLYSKRCEVVVRDVAIRVSPKYAHSSEATHFFKSKEEFIATVQGTLADAAKDEKTGKVAKNGFLDRLQQTILKNLAFRFENISLQLEDKTGCWKGESAGLQALVRTLTCEAADASYKPVFVHPDDTTFAEPLYRLISYEGFSVRLLYAPRSSSDSAKPPPQVPSHLGDWQSRERSGTGEEIFASSAGVLTLCYQPPQQQERNQPRARPCVTAALRVAKASLRWNATCITAIGILLESVKQAPYRTFAWGERPAERLGRQNAAVATQWWRYAIHKVVAHRRAERDRQRFSWAAYRRRKTFLAAFYTFCLRLLEAPWLTASESASVDEVQLAQTSTQDVMACWNAARECVAQFAATGEASRGKAYPELMHYRTQNEGSSSAPTQQQIDPATALPVELALTVECAHFTVALHDNLEAAVIQTYIGVAVKKKELCVKASILSASIVADGDDASPVLTVTGSDAAGVLVAVSKQGHGPASGSFVVEAVQARLDLTLQELLVGELVSYVVAARPFMKEEATPAAPLSPTSDVAESRVDRFETIKKESFSTFRVVVKSITGSADGVSVHVQMTQAALEPGTPIVVQIQEVSAAAQGAALLQLSSIAVTPTLGGDGIAVGVVTDSANVSANVEGFEHVKLMLSSLKQRWATTSAQNPTAGTVPTELPKHEKPPLKIAVRFEFIEFGALALESFCIGATLGDGWHIHMSAAGSTTEGWCHSIPPRSLDPFIDIHIWADRFLVHSPFSGNIEDNGIAFTCHFNHVTLCIGDELIASVESLYDTVMLMLFQEEDRHVYLSERAKYTIPHISGSVRGSDLRLLLRSSGGDFSLLPTPPSQPVEEKSRGPCATPAVPPPPPPPPLPLTVELLGEDALHVVLHRYCDKRMDIQVELQNDINAFLTGTPAHTPLLVQREKTRAEVELHLCAPSVEDLAIFPYGRLEIAVKLTNVAVVTHIPTLLALWTYFNTPSLPLCRLRNIASRVHFTSRPSRPGKTLAPRSPTSSTVEGVGSAAFARITELPGLSGRGRSAPPALVPCATYSTPVFPSDMRLSVEVADSELYYPWGEGCVAPLYLHAEVPQCEVAMLNRNDCAEVSVRGLLAVPRVAAALHPSTPATSAAPHVCTRSTRGASSSSRSRTSADDSEEGAAAPDTQAAAELEEAEERHEAPLSSGLPPAAHGTSSSGGRSAAASSRTPHASQLEDTATSGPNAACPASAAFPDETHDASAPGASPPIQVHVMYTMDSRPPFSPGNSDESLRVSLTGTAGPLHMCLRSPAEAAVWLTFFTFFNATNTVPLSAAASGPAAAAAAATGAGVAPPASPTTPPPNPRRLLTSVQTSPIVFHLPFAGAAAVLWNGAAFVASPGYSALRLPTLDVLVHEQLLSTTTTARTNSAAVSMPQLTALRDGGYAVVSLRGGNGDGAEAAPALALETRSTGPTAAEVRRQLVVPALRVRLAVATTLAHLQRCAALAGLQAVWAARSAQFSLLNAVVVQESRRRGVRYACSEASLATQLRSGTSAGGGGGANAAVEEELRPFLSFPLAMVVQTGCVTYEWASRLRRGVLAGVTVGVANLRCNDFEDYDRPRAGLSTLTTAATPVLSPSDRRLSSEGSDTAFVSPPVGSPLLSRPSLDTSTSPPEPCPLSTTMPFLLATETVEAYAWWSTAKPDGTHNSAPGDGEHGGGGTAVEGGAIAAAAADELLPCAVPPAGGASPPRPTFFCVPLLLHPLQVRTRIDLQAAPASPWRTTTAATAAAAATTAQDAQEMQGAEVNSRVRADDHEDTAHNSIVDNASLHTMPSTTTSSSSSSFRSPTGRDGSHAARSSFATTATAAAAGTAAVATPDVAPPPPTSVFEVSPVHVVLSTPAYELLSERLAYGASVAPAAPASPVPLSTTPPAAVAVPPVCQYYLTHHAVDVPVLARCSPTTVSASGFSSPLSLPGVSRWSSLVGGDAGASVNATSSVARAEAGQVERRWVYRYDTASQNVWAEEASAAGTCTGTATPGALAATPYISLSSVHAVDGQLLLPSNGGADAAAAAAGEADVSDRPPSAPRAAATPGPPPLPLRPSTPFSAPPVVQVRTVTVPPRLQTRLLVAEVCVRLVSHSADVDGPADTASAAVCDFWQRYTTAHAVARHAAAATASSSSSSPHRPCLLTFLAATVPSLQCLRAPTTYISLSPSNIKSNSSSATARAWQSSGLLPPSHSNRAVGTSATTTMTTRTTTVAGGEAPLPISSPTSSLARSLPLPLPAQQQQQLLLFAPTTMLEEACVDALCVHICGLAVSSFTDARSVVLESCVCTSVKSPGRPLLSLTQMELYVPTTSVTYPSAATAPSRNDPVATLNTNVRGGEAAQPHAGSSHPTPSTSDAAAVAPSKGDGGRRVGAVVTMAGEVGCRVETLTIDLSAAALRAWLSSLVKQPVAVLRAAAEERDKPHPPTTTTTTAGKPAPQAAASSGAAAAERDKPHPPTTTTTTAGKPAPQAAASSGAAAAAAGVPASPLLCRPGQGLWVHEVREVHWALGQDLVLSRDGLVLFFSNQDTNILTVHLNGHDISIDPALLTRPPGLQRVVMVVQGGLTVRLVGRGRVRLPLAMWTPTLLETAAHGGVETVLLPFMAVGEGSYLECSEVRLGFTEHGGSGDKALAAPAETPTTPEAALPANPSPPPPPQAVVHRSVHLHLPHISLLLEPRNESRLLHLRTAAESWMALCGAQLLRDDVRCTGLTLLSEPVYDAATTTSRTTVLAPVDISVCSSNGRHHAVSLGAVQVDLGRADVLLLSTYLGELQALRVYAKYLTHSKVEKEFLELVEGTLAWKASAADANTAGGHAATDTANREPSEFDNDNSSSSSSSGGDEILHPTGPEGTTQMTAPTSPASEPPALVRGGPTSPVRPTSRQPASPSLRAFPTTRGRQDARASTAATATATASVREADEEMRELPPPSHASDGDRQERRRRRQRRRLLREQSRGFSWAVFTPAAEVTFSDHRYPLVQLRVHDVTLRRTSSDAGLSSTSLVQCQRASVRVYGRGRWDVLLKPSAALTWSLTQTVSRHSSNQHVAVMVEGVHLQCSHLIVAKLLYLNRQFGLLAASLRRRLTAAAAAATASDANVGGGGGAVGRFSAPDATGAAVDSAPSADSDRAKASNNTDSTSNTSSRSEDTDASGDGDREDGASSDSTSTYSDNGKDAAESGAGSAFRRRRGGGGTGAAAAAAVPVPIPMPTARSASARSPTPGGTAPSAGVPYTEAPHQHTVLPPPSSATAAVPAALHPAAAAVAAVPPSMATHRLLNSFNHTLFAGICEREAVEPATAATPAAAGTTGAMLWRCRELYRLLPASGTDIFISYRRARSLMLTFFTTACVEWDGAAGAWVLNATGETALAARAIIGAGAGGAAAALAARGSSPSSIGHSRPQQPFTSPTSGGAAAGPSLSAVTAAATNWFGFTSLQYGLARPLMVRTTAPGSAATAAASPLSPPHDTHHVGSAESSSFRRPRAVAFALALTCVDPEEEADTTRYPIVLASEETQHHNSDSDDGGDDGGCCCSTGEDSVARETGRHTRTRPQLRRRHRSFVTDAIATSTDASTPLTSNAAPNSLGDGGGGAPLSTSGLPPGHLYGTRAARPMHHGAPLPRRRPPPLQPQTKPRTAALDGAGGSSSSSSDLLVVRLQARSSLLNETGCVLELRTAPPPQQDTVAPSPSGRATPDVRPAAAAASSGPTAVVPPGWQLPLDEQDVHQEVLLRVCCPSTRLVTTPPPSASAPVDEAVGGVARLCWYEARLQLSDLESGRFLPFRRVPACGNNAVTAATGSAAAAAAATNGPTSPPLPPVVPWPRRGGDRDRGGALLHSRPTSEFFSGDDDGDDHDERLLVLFVLHTYSADGLVQHIALYPRLTLVNHLGLPTRVAVFQQDPLAGPQTPDEATLIAPWTAPYVERGRHERERFHRSLVALGAHDALPHQHALPLHFCTYGSNLVLGLSFTQSTGDAFFTADLNPVITHLRDAVDHHPRLLPLRDSHGSTFYVQVSVMPRTVVLSVAVWVYNLTEYPLLLSDSILRRRLCPGQSSTSGIIPSQGEPFLIGCRLADFTQGFFAIGMDGGWSGAVPIDLGSSGVFVSALSRLGVMRSCNYTILFPNAQEGRPIVIQITPRWVFYNNTPKRLRLHFYFPGLSKATRQAERQRRRLLLLQAPEATSGAGARVVADPVGVSAQGEAAPQAERRRRQLQEADDRVAALTSIAVVQLNPGDYHVSCIGPIEGNQFQVQEVLQGTLPTITSITGSGRVEHRDVAAYYESQRTPHMDVDRPGEAVFNLWAAPRAAGKRVAVSYGGDLIVHQPTAPHPTALEPYDMYATDAVITGRIAVAVQNADNVLTVLLQPIQGTKILVQNRTQGHTVMVRQQGSRRRNRIPPRQNRFFLWEDARQEHAVRVHVLGYKARWYDVDFSAGECRVTRSVDVQAAAAAEALEHAQQRHPHPSAVRPEVELRSHAAAAAAGADFPFHVRGYTDAAKTRVTILVTETPVPGYAAIDSWRTSQVVSLRLAMVHLTWIQEMSNYVAAAAQFATPFAVDEVEGVAAGAMDGEEGPGRASSTNTAAAAAAAGGEEEVVAVHVPPPEAAAGWSTFPAARFDAVRRSIRQRLFHQHGSRAAPNKGTAGGAAAPLSSVANVELFSVILEGVQLERLATEDNESFFFAIHQMQWVDEKEGVVFLYRARPRLAPSPSASAAAAGSSSSPASSSALHRTTSPRRRRRRCLPPRPPRTPQAAAFADTDGSEVDLGDIDGRRCGGSGRLGCGVLAAAASTANRLLDAVLRRSDAFLLSMEKDNDLEVSYNLIKYADGVTRYTELRYALTPLVVVLTDFWLVDVIQEVRRLRVLLGLRKQTTASQTTTTTTAPLVLTVSTLQHQQQQQQEQPSAEARRASQKTPDADDAVVVAAQREDASALPSRVLAGQVASLMPSRQHTTNSSTDVVLVDAEGEPAAAAGEAAVPAPRHRSPTDTDGHASSRRATSPASPRTAHSADSDDSGSGSGAGTLRPGRVWVRQTRRRRRRTSADTVARPVAARGRSTTSRTSSARNAPSAHAHGPSSPHHHHHQQQQQQQQQQSSSGNTTGFLPQTIFLQQLVQEVRARLELQGTGVLVGSLAGIRGGRRGRSRSGGGGVLSAATPQQQQQQQQQPSSSLLGAGGGIGGLGAAGRRSRRRQLLMGGTATAVRHHRGAVRRGGPGDGLVSAAATFDADGTLVTGNAVGGGGGTVVSTGAMGGGGGTAAGAGAVGTVTEAPPSVNPAAFMFIERLEVQRVTLYVTFLRHSPDPLRPLLGAYAWMLPSQLRQREFYLPAWTLTRQVETPASLRARLARWGTQSLREQWTKVTKLGTLLDALQFWQHRTPPLHGPPRTLTLSHVQQQLQASTTTANKPNRSPSSCSSSSPVAAGGGGRGGKRAAVPFATCVSSGSESEEEENDDDEGEDNSEGVGTNLRR